MDRPVYRSPLAAKTPGGVLDMREITDFSLVNLRGQGDEFRRAAAKVLGAELPAANTAVSVGDGRTIFWLGPDEWLVRDMRESAPKALFDLSKTMHAAAVEVSDYYALIRFGGGSARHALADGCPLDLEAFAAGQCAQSRLGVAAILLHQTDDSPTYEAQVRWSFADYVWEYLRTAAGE